jgi:hypothetical protein
LIKTGTPYPEAPTTFLERDYHDYNDIGGNTMGALKGTKPVTDRNIAKIGLLANGSSGSWEIAIDETISGKDRWFAQLEGPAISFYFEIPSPRIIDDTIDYLGPGCSSPQGNSQSANRNAPLRIGGDKRMPVSLVRDDEFADRIFLVVGSDSAPVIRYTFSGPDISMMLEALRQVKEDLDS